MEINNKIKSKILKYFKINLIFLYNKMNITINLKGKGILILK